MTEHPYQVNIRPLKKNELAETHQIFRLAFGTFVGMPDPLSFGGDSDFIRPRWQAHPENAFVGEMVKDGSRTIAGTNFVVRWGSFGYFGPLTVVPEYWGHGVGTQLTAEAVRRFDAWGLTHRGLFTFCNSPKHLELYRKFGFWPRFLLAIMELRLDSGELHIAPPHEVWTTFDRLDPAGRERALAAAREFTGNLLPGLDLCDEMQTIDATKFGKTVLLWDGDTLRGLAVTHLGPGSEAGSGAMYVRFAAVKPGATADFEQLLQASAAVARAGGAEKLVAGASLECETAYKILRQRGAQTAYQGVTMHGNNDPAYFHKDALVLGDWR